MQTTFFRTTIQNGYYPARHTAVRMYWLHGQQDTTQYSFEHISLDLGLRPARSLTHVTFPASELVRNGKVSTNPVREKGTGRLLAAFVPGFAAAATAAATRIVTCRRDKVEWNKTVSRGYFYGSMMWRGRNFFSRYTHILRITAEDGISRRQAGELRLYSVFLLPLVFFPCICVVCSLSLTLLHHHATRIIRGYILCCSYYFWFDVFGFPVVFTLLFVRH